MKRPVLLLLFSALAMVGPAACASDDGDATAPRDGERGEVADVETPATGSVETEEDVDNPTVYGYEVDGPVGTTVVIESTLVAQGQEQPPFTATWSITDRPRWALYTNWVESGEVAIEVTEGGPATVRIIRARYVDPDDPSAGIDEIEEVGTLDVDASSTDVIGFS